MNKETRRNNNETEEKELIRKLLKTTEAIGELTEAQANLSKALLKWISRIIKDIEERGK